MEARKINVQFRDGREDTYDEHLAMHDLYTIPRVEEIIWFPNDIKDYFSWEVIDVCHWVGSGDVCVYVVPVEIRDEL
jgi:hypothetical protein